MKYELIKNNALVSDITKIYRSVNVKNSKIEYISLSLTNITLGTCTEERLDSRLKAANYLYIDNRLVHVESETLTELNA